MTTNNNNYKVYSLHELIERDFPPKEYLLRPIIPKKSLTMIHSNRGIGKTFLSLDIAITVSSGTSTLGWKAEKKYKVLIIDGEMNLSDIKERILKLIKPKQDYFDDTSYLRILSQDAQEYGLMDLATQEGKERVFKEVKDSDLIILDNISSLFIGNGRENEAENATALNNFCLDLKRLGKSVLIIHHSGKSGTQRGTSKKEDFLDVVIKLEKPLEYNPYEGSKFNIIFEKNRGIYGDDVMPFQAILKTDSNGSMYFDKQEIKVDSTNQNYEKIKDLQTKGYTQKDIGIELQIDQSTVSRYLKKTN